MTVVRETPSASVSSRSLGSRVPSADPAVADEQHQRVGQPGVGGRAVEVADEGGGAGGADRLRSMQATVPRLAIQRRPISAHDWRRDHDRRPAPRPCPTSARSPSSAPAGWPPPAAAARRPGPVRRLAGDDGPRRPRAGAVGRAALRPDPARADHARPGASSLMSFVVLVLLDPAARDARARHDRQRARGRLLRRRHAGAARPARRAGGPDRADGRRRRALRARQRDVHRRPARPRSRATA